VSRISRYCVTDQPLLSYTSGVMETGHITRYNTDTGGAGRVRTCDRGIMSAILWFSWLIGVHRNTPRPAAMHSPFTIINQVRPGVVVAL
jgi:hypothetical protein